MNCAKWEAEIALYAGGDLPARRVAPLENHLAVCARCRALLQDLRAGQALLAELRDDPLPPAMLARVRANVLAEVGAPRPSRPYWKLAPAAALALALATALLSPRHRAVEPPQPTPAAPVRMAEARPAEVVPVRHRALRRHRRPPAAKSGPPLLVQFVTDDPNIVIYWLVDQKPEGD